MSSKKVWRKGDAGMSPLQVRRRESSVTSDETVPWSTYGRRREGNNPRLTYLINRRVPGDGPPRPVSYTEGPQRRQRRDAIHVRTRAPVAPEKRPGKGGTNQGGAFQLLAHAPVAERGRFHHAFPWASPSTSRRERAQPGSETFLYSWLSPSDDRTAEEETDRGWRMRREFT